MENGGEESPPSVETAIIARRFDLLNRAVQHLLGRSYSLVTPIVRISLANFSSSVRIRAASWSGVPDHGSRPCATIVFTTSGSASALLIAPFMRSTRSRLTPAGPKREIQGFIS